MSIKTAKYDIENLPVLNTDIGALEFQPIPFNVCAIERLEKEYQSIVFSAIRPNGDLMLFDAPPVYSGDKTYPWETSNHMKSAMYAGRVYRPTEEMLMNFYIIDKKEFMEKGVP